jgi:HEPN domain-containing protein
MDSNVVIDCHHCSTRVNARVVGAVHEGDSGCAVVLVECPACHTPLVGQTATFWDDTNTWRYEQAERVWPAPFTLELSASIPEQARRDIKDAQKCISHGIYSAAAVLCGRALERFAKVKVPGKSLHEALKDLKAQGEIDSRLFDWANILRKERNLGAHAGDEEVTKENAEDVLAFTIAIFEYVFTLSEKYAEFVARKASHTPDPP